MKTRHLLFLFLVFSALAGIYFYQARPHKDTTGREGPYTVIFPRDATGGVDEVTAWVGTRDKAATPLHLVKKDGTWWVELVRDGKGFRAPAKEERAKRLTGRMAGLFGERRAEGKGLFKTFHLGDSEALHIVMKSHGQERLHLLVGKRGPAWDSSFVRKKGDDTIYLAGINILSLFDIWAGTPEGPLEPRPWVELALVPYGPDEIEGLSYARGNRQWSLVHEKEPQEQSASSGSKARGKEKGAPAWTFTLNGKAARIKAGDARGFLSAVFPLRAKDCFPPSDAEKAGFGPGERYGRLTIHLKGGRGVKILHTGKLDGAARAGWIRDQRGLLFQVDSKVFKKLEDPGLSQGG